MTIGILADTHNHVANTQQALELFRERGITQLIHCGDVTSAEVMLLFARWQVTFVLGNAHQINASLLMPGNSIAASIANEFAEATTPMYQSALLALGFVLFIVTFVVLAAARLMLMRLNRREGR